MICNIHFEIQGEENIKSILNCGLSFNKVITKRSSYYSSSFGGWMRSSERPIFTIEVFPESQIVKVKGNMHYYYNDGKHNANDFYYEDLTTCIDKISKILHITADKAILRGFEFGVNISPSFKLEPFFNGLLCLRTAIAEKDHNTSFELYRFDFSQFYLKVYNKSKMFNIDTPILRIELHIKKMQWIQKQIPKLTSLANLQNKECMYLLGEILYKTIEDILIIESLNNSLMTSKEVSTWRRIIKKDSWENINPEQRRRQKKDFNNMTSRFRVSYLKYDLLTLISDKWHCLLVNTPMILQGVKPSQKIIKNHDFTGCYDKSKNINLPLMLKGNFMANSKTVKLIESSFIGKTGKFYILNPTDINKFAVYESAEHYDKRLSLPNYIYREEAEKDFNYYLPIDLNTLTTIKL